MGNTIRETPSSKVVAGSTPSGAALRAKSAAHDQDLEQAVEYVVADCFFAVGQTIGMRTTVDYEAVAWWHDHYRTKFLEALRRGNDWREARENVTAVGWMLAERAVRHAAGRDSIDIDAAQRAAADVERYCQHRAERAARTQHDESAGDSRLAGFWCVPRPC
ncbi:MAG: hypothetical protein OXH52_07010 [Gammaproteobacteria bacterium]|nr:hypothetical protein [Gammaproteobacteria bacterium]